MIHKGIHTPSPRGGLVWRDLGMQIDSLFARLDELEVAGKLFTIPQQVAVVQTQVVTIPQQVPTKAASSTAKTLEEWFS